MNQIVLNNIRVQLLSEDIVRIEYMRRGEFYDGNTFFIPDKAQYINSGAIYTQEENVICFGEYELYIPEDAKSLSGVKLEKNGKRVYTYKKLSNSGELPPLDKTPEVFAISDSPRIIIPEGGYSVERKGEYKVDDKVQDIYLLLCQKDAKKLRRLYVELTGRCELVRLSTLGGWNSKYYAYTQEEAEKLILDYEKHNIPLDVMVIDTDWRSCENGWGYDVDEKLFPDMKGFLDFAHSHGVDICFNDHPQPVNGAKIFAPKEIAYREKNLQSLMQKGLDIWWYDRNWSVKLNSPSKGVTHETLGLYLFSDITSHYYQKLSGDKNVYRRPDIMGNVDNVANGCYLNIHSSASHRYSIQWTGDIESSLSALGQEVDNLIKCTNNCIAYVNSDCGGHVGNPDKDTFVRWMQFGTLSPVFRPHCTKDVVRSREPWVFDEEAEDIVRNFNNLRYRLLPVIYKNAYEAYKNGTPIFASMGFNYPGDKKALAAKDEYMLGNDILIAPIADVTPRLLTDKDYLSPVKAVFYDGTELKGEPLASAEWKSLGMTLNHESPEKGVPVYNFSAKFKTAVQFDKDMRLYIKCDDGATVWVDGKKVLEDKTLHSAMLFPLCCVAANKPHTVEVEYFQAGGEASCMLCCAEAPDCEGKKVYLPNGKWLDVFSGKVHTGKKTIQREYALGEMPLYVRLGSLIPLAYEAKNTKEQKWDNLVYDFYPCKEACDSGYLYEDDTETTAYKLEQYRKSAYEAKYCEKCNAFVIKLHSAEGTFAGEKCFNERKITLKYHLLKGVDKVMKITVNGEEAEGEWVRRNAKTFPLDTEKSSPDSGTILVTLDTDTNKEYEIKFYL